MPTPPSQPRGDKGPTHAPESISGGSQGTRSQGATCPHPRVNLGGTKGQPTPPSQSRGDHRVHAQHEQLRQHRPMQRQLEEHQLAQHQLGSTPVQISASSDQERPQQHQLAAASARSTDSATLPQHQLHHQHGSASAQSNLSSKQHQPESTTGRTAPSQRLRNLQRVQLHKASAHCKCYKISQRCPLHAWKLLRAIWNHYLEKLSNNQLTLREKTSSPRPRATSKKS